MKSLFVLILGVIITFNAFAAPQKARIESLKIEQSSGKLRVSFDVSKNIQYKAFTLKSPNRVVVDFKNTSAAQRVFKFTPSQDKNPISGIRHAVQNGKDLRVVFDVDSSVGMMSRLKKSRSGSRIELVLSNPSIGKNLKQAKSSKSNPNKSKVVARAEKESKPIRSKRPHKDDFIVVIDAGHGGKDPGAIGLNGVYEKTVVLSIAKKLKDKVNSQRGMRAIMTRDNDKFVALKERVKIASRSGADLFISVHANSNMRRSMSGSSVYILSRRGASSQAAHFIAARENAHYGHTLEHIDFGNRNRMLKTVLLDLTKTSTITRSLDLARGVLKELGFVNNLQRGRVESAAFVVLKSLDIPSMLVETAYISNPKEEQQLTQAPYQKKLADAIFRGVKRYYVKNSPKARNYARAGGRYVVKSGDTLMGIARRHKVSLTRLKQANSLSSSTIKVGQKLKIPAS